MLKYACIGTPCREQNSFFRKASPSCEKIGENMKYDEMLMQQDIEMYGLYTYEDFAEYLSYEQFEAFQVRYMKISVGKGKATFEDILALIATYVQ